MMKFSICCHSTEQSSKTAPVIYLFLLIVHLRSVPHGLVTRGVVGWERRSHTFLHYCNVTWRCGIQTITLKHSCDLTDVLATHRFSLLVKSLQWNRKIHVEILAGCFDRSCLAAFTINIFITKVCNTFATTWIFANLRHPSTWSLILRHQWEGRWQKMRYSIKRLLAPSHS